MSNLNKVQLIGHLGDDVKLHFFENGDCRGQVSLATTKQWKNKEGETQSDTQWHNIVFRNKTAEIVEKYAKKGSKLYVEGELRNRSWESNGEKKYITEIHALNFEFLTPKSDNDTSNDARENQFNPQSALRKASSQAINEIDNAPPPEEDDDLPF